MMIHNSTHIEENKALNYILDGWKQKDRLTLKNYKLEVGKNNHSERSPEPADGNKDMVVIVEGGVYQKKSKEENYEEQKIKYAEMVSENKNQKEIIQKWKEHVSIFFDIC